EGVRVVRLFAGTGPAAPNAAVPADVDAADIDDRIFRTRLAAHELVGVRDRDHFFHAREILEHEGIGDALAGDADGGAMHAGDDVGFQPHLLDLAGNSFDLFGA